MKHSAGNLKLRILTLVTPIFVTSTGISSGRVGYLSDHAGVLAAAINITNQNGGKSSVYNGLSDVSPARFTRQAALNDPFSRVPSDFSIPEGFGPRVSFWFDIYTKYGGSANVIHHVKYPWIIFKVVDTSDIENNKKLHRWTRYHRAQKLVRDEVAKVRASLQRLAKAKTYKNLNTIDQENLKILAAIPGPRKNVFREAAQNFRVQLGQKDFFVSGLLSSSKYLPYMEAEFKSVGMPTELTRLPFVESSFNEHAESKVGASGIWQIMPATGRMFGLKVNDTIDERNSPLKASLAAVEILRENKRILKQWPLAISAYNHGPSGIRSALRASRTDNLVDLVQKYYRGNFQFASANFYACFLAVLHAEKYHKEIFPAESLARMQPMPHAVFELKRPLRAKALLHASGLSHEDFLAYNLDLKDALRVNAFLPKNHKVLLPPRPSLSNAALLREASYSPARDKKRRG